MWALALFSCVDARRLRDRGSLGGCRPTGPVCVSPIAGVALAASIWGSYTPTPLSPWAERLLPTVTIAAIAVAVSSWPTGRMPARWSRAVRTGRPRLRDRRTREQVRLRRRVLHRSAVVAATSVGAADAHRPCDERSRSQRRCRVAPRRRADPVPRIRRPSPCEHAGERAQHVTTCVHRRRGVRRLGAVGVRVDDGGRTARQASADATTPIGMVGACVGVRSLRRRRAAARVVGVDATATQDGEPVELVAIELGPVETGLDASEEVARILGDPSARRRRARRRPAAARSVADDGIAGSGPTPPDRALITIADRDGCDRRRRRARREASSSAPSPATR